jgi:hypothetical protein
MSCTLGLREMVDWWCGSPSRWTHTSVSPVSLVRNWRRQFTGTPPTVPAHKRSTSHGVFGIARPCMVCQTRLWTAAVQPWLVAFVMTLAEYYQIVRQLTSDYARNALDILYTP